MLAVAQTYVKGRAVAEEVVQSAWLGVIKGLDRFEGRSSLKTWILSILVNLAKTRGVREARSVPFATLAGEAEEPAVDADRFRGPHESFPGHWRAFPGDWGRSAATAVQDRETLRVVMGAIAGLPDAQHTVIRMRDVEGFSSE
jgi:RNA polymerase sigma-70 factor (ECF subfamily)